MKDYQPSKAAYSVAEFCSCVSLGRTTVFAAIKAGKIRTLKVGSRTIIPADELHAFLASLSHGLR